MNVLRYIFCWILTHFFRCVPRNGITLFIYLFLIFFKFYFIFKLYKIVLVLPNIKMNLPLRKKKNESATGIHGITLFNFSRYHQTIYQSFAITVILL